MEVEIMNRIYLQLFAEEGEPDNGGNEQTISVWWNAKMFEINIKKAKEKSTLRKQDALNVSVDLFSRAAARQVFSALKSLTTVFGMGTGGPSS